MVLHGIEKVDFPKRIGKRPDDLIRRLCKYGPITYVSIRRERIFLCSKIIIIKKKSWFLFLFLIELMQIFIILLTTDLLALNTKQYELLDNYVAAKNISHANMGHITLNVAAARHVLSHSSCCCCCCCWLYEATRYVSRLVLFEQNNSGVIKTWHETKRCLFCLSGWAQWRGWGTRRTASLT